MVSPTRNAAFEAPVFAWKAILLSLMKCMVSCLMQTVKWQCRVRYSTENRLLHNAVTFTGLSYLIALSDSLSLGLSSSSVLSLPPHPVHFVLYQMTCLSGPVTFHTVLWCSITITGTTSISGTTTGTLSIRSFPTTTTSGICLAVCTIYSVPSLPCSLISEFAQSSPLCCHH
jgi:hypothetical protein